jgi:hypothetical protein
VIMNLTRTIFSRSELDIESDRPELTPSESDKEPINVLSLINQSIHIS